MPARRSRLAFFIPAVVLAGVVHGAMGRALQQKPSTPDATSCLFDLERGEVPDCIRQAANGELLVSPQVLKLLDFEARVPWDLEKFWIGHANKDVTDKYAEQIAEDVEYRREWTERVGMGFDCPEIGKVEPNAPKNNVVVMKANAA